MLGFLGNILAAIEDLPQLIVVGSIDVLNLLLAGFGTVISGLFAVLPSMPAPPSVDSGDWLSWLNWTFPVGEAITLLAGVIVAYVAYLAIAYVLRLLRAV